MRKLSGKGGAAAVALALASSLGLAAMANAAPGDGRLMPTETQGSLTIHKYDGEPTTLPNNGMPVDADDLPAGLVPLENAGFTVQRLSCVNGDRNELLDLKTNDGWITAADIFDKAGSNPSSAALLVAAKDVVGFDCTLSAGTEQKTGTTGETTFTPLDLGLYYVTETTTPPGFKTVLPFLVTIPMTDPVGDPEADPVVAPGTGWIYDINVYPKDRPESKKTVKDQDVTSTKVGELVEWTITSPAPYNPEGTKGYYMVDQLDPKLAFASSTNVWLGEAGATSGTELTRGNDYDIYLYKDAGTGVETVYMELTAAGITNLDNAVVANKALYVNWSFKTAVTAPGAIENDATIYENSPNTGQTTEPCEDEPCTPEEEKTPPPPVCEPTDPTCGEETPKVTTKFGGVTLTKIAKDADSTKLAGAEFKVVGGHDKDTVCTSGTDTGLTGVTDASGALTLQPLRASDWANGEQLTITKDDDDNDAIPPEWMFYCLIETKAPAGYELLPEGLTFQIITAAGGNATGEELTVAYGDVINVPSKGGFQLPLTGGIGTIIFLILGAGVVGGSFAYARRQNKKNAA